SAVEPSRSGSPLVPIQPEGSAPPFFCVHPSGGSVLCYLDLARLLGTGQPFYGLQGPDPRSGREPFERIEEMAAVYLAAIREGGFQGPWRLGGYSFGGCVAFEMARQLVAAGEEAPFLALLDTRAPLGLDQQPEGGLVADLAAVLERHALDDEAANLAEEKALWDDLTELAEVHLRKVYGEEREPGRRRPSRMGALQRFFRAYRFLPTGEEIDYREVRRYLRFLRANFRSSRAYAPAAPYPHGAVLFQSTDRLTDAETAPEVQAGRWRRLVGELEVRPVPGHHLHLLAAPAVEVLARELGRSLSLV
ncbi:MAG TPA: thioesterase domain-containing protein, partial [Thermoanaerobaculia bacterium]|nr:thioesterase domain-containing protein [Thermoanaerobaculia bacterium]